MRDKPLKNVRFILAGTEEHLFTTDLHTLPRPGDTIDFTSEHEPSTAFVVVGAPTRWGLHSFGPYGSFAEVAAVAEHTVILRELK